jgi:hypothetical protein
MPTPEQRWLSLSGICTQLSMSEVSVRQLAKAGYLVTIGKGINLRFLDPTPEYASKLRLAEALHDQSSPLPKDFDLTNFLTIGEVAEVCGWTMSTARSHMSLYKIPSVKVGRYNLYSIAVVRDILWKRKGRKKACKQRAPFLIRDIIAYFLDYQASQASKVPSDEQFAADDLLQRKIAQVLKMRSPGREAAMQELMAKVDLAKKVVALL